MLAIFALEGPRLPLHLPDCALPASIALVARLLCRIVQLEPSLCRKASQMTVSASLVLLAATAPILDKLVLLLPAPVTLVLFVWVVPRRGIPRMVSRGSSVESEFIVPQVATPHSGVLLGLSGVLCRLPPVLPVPLAGTVRRKGLACRSLVRRVRTAQPGPLSLSCVPLEHTRIWVSNHHCRIASLARSTSTVDPVD